MEDWKGDQIDQLAEVLRAAIYAGASISFITPFSLDEARVFWDAKAKQVRSGGRRVINALDGDRIVGTVQLDLDTPPNQQHRAEIAKLLVHPDARRQGIARKLMVAIEDAAHAAGRTLVTLDTATGGPAELLYRSMGYSVAGVIPNFARGSLTPELHGTTIMYKELAPVS
jgi:ribosomal protein S18 acetylase RimI-like enzyme